MKKIVFFSGGINRSGGTERSLTEVANGLGNAGYEVTIVSLCGNSCYYPLETGINIIYLESPGLSKKVLRNLSKLKHIVESIRPDYWVDVDYILGIYTKRIKGKHPSMKWISWEHFCYFYEYPYYKGLRKLIRKDVCTKADALVVLTKEDEKDYTDNINLKAKIFQIYNAIPYDKKENDNSNKEKIVLAAGRLTKIKGFDLLIDSWEKIENDFPDWKLIIAGEGEEKDNLIKYAEGKKLKHVEIKGFEKNMKSLYEKSAIFALPSRNEGFVMVLLEAMSQGLPCVAYDCKCGVKEIIDNGINGYSVECFNESVFSQKLIELMSDDKLRNQMGNKARMKTEEFTKEKIIDKWINMLESI